MASLTGGFAPIAGAGSKDKSNASGGKKSDLTGGLISLSGGGGGGSASTRRASDDVDFSDFDVDDLLLDDAGGGSKSSKSKSKSSKASASSASSPSKKKKSSSSSKKKSKDKSSKKKSGGGGVLDFLDDDDDDDWDKEDDDDVAAKAKKTNDFTPPVKTNNRLDDEFARMLGLEDDFAATGRRQSDSAVDDVGEFSPVKQNNYAPTVSATRTETAAKAPEPVETDAGGGQGGGLDASFFQDEGKSKSDADSSSFLSFLSSGSSGERRGGRGPAGRRGGVGAEDKGGSSLFADPFEKSDAPARSRNGGGGGGGGLEDLFATSSRTTKQSKAETDDFGSEATGATTAKPAGSKSTFESLFGGAGGSRGKSANDPEPAKKSLFPAEEDDLVPIKPVPRALSTAPKPVAASAKDDLLAELFPADPPRATKKALPVKEESALQDDLLSELFPAESTKGKQPQSRSPEPPSPPPPMPQSHPSPPVQKAPVVDEEPGPGKASAVNKPASSSSIGGLKDVDSARDSLLSDLLAESPPRSRRAARDSHDKAALTPLPEETIKQMTPSVVAEDPPSSPVRRPSLSPPKPLPPQPTALPTKAVSPPPSPGKTKTLALGTPSKVREVEFEQSKDELLEEILASAPASPLRSQANATTLSPHGSRRNSYSLSFDLGDGSLAAPTEPLTPSSASPRPRRASRSPDKHEQVLSPALAATSGANNVEASVTPSTAAPVSTQPPAAAPVATTVFLRDVQAEEELKRQHATEITALVTQHAEERARLEQEKRALELQVSEERAKLQYLETHCEATHLSQIQQLQDQLAALNADFLRLQSEHQALSTQHTLQLTQSQLTVREKEALAAQLQRADDQNRSLLTQLTQEKQVHQHTQLEFTNFRRDTEQAAQLQSQKERAQMDRLFQQLQTSLAQLNMLQEQASDEVSSKRELETASRLRMISSLEATSRSYASTTQDECHKLTSLLSNLEATLRAYRQEHLDEKERLRQEQMRLNVLAQHFQAQTSVLNEKSDANAQLLAQYLSQSLQDVRVAEARLATRRKQLTDQEQQLHEERAAFASYREEWMEQQQHEYATLANERSQIEKDWRALAREKEDLEDVLASHEDAFQAMKQQQLVLEQEKERVAVGALHVAEMAQRFEGLTKQLVDKEHAMRQQRDAMEDMRRQWHAREQSVASDKQKLDERELRLHAQLRQLETARKRMNEERKQQLQHRSNQREAVDMAMGASGGFNGKMTETLGSVRSHIRMATPSSYAVSTASYSTTPAWPQPTPTHSTPVAPSFTAASYSSSTPDPSGFSASFRQLLEENWQKQQQGDDRLTLHKQRMAIHCLGLDTSSSATTKAMTTDCSSSHAATSKASITLTKAQPSGTVANGRTALGKASSISTGSHSSSSGGNRQVPPPPPARALSLQL